MWRPPTFKEVSRVERAVADFDRYESDVEDQVASIRRGLDAGGVR